MTSEVKQAAQWPLDALEGAKMILTVFQTIYHPGHVVMSAKDISFDNILDDAEYIVKEALSRSRENCKAGPMGEFFEQQTSTGLPPVKP